MKIQIFLFHERLADLAITENPKELKIFEDIYKTDYMLIAKAIAENRQTPDYILEHYSDLDNMNFKVNIKFKKKLLKIKKKKIEKWIFSM